MNCKPGDLAVIVRSAEGQSIGQIVDCIALDGKHSEFGPVWRVRANSRGLVTIHGTLAAVCHVPDAWLRPIRDQDGPDEATQWVGKPATVEA